MPHIQRDRYFFNFSSTYNSIFNVLFHKHSILLLYDHDSLVFNNYLLFKIYISISVLRLVLYIYIYIDTLELHVMTSSISIGSVPVMNFLIINK